MVSKVIILAWVIFLLVLGHKSLQRVLNVGNNAVLNASPANDTLETC
jgi:hypothetical protein